MRKKVFGRKFSRGRGGRTALFRSLVRALVLNGSIKTTKIKAKAIQADVDKLITKAKQDSLASRRMVLAKLGNDVETFDRLLGSVVASTKNRTSGYTRIVNLPRRRGDLAEIAILEFVDKIEVSAKAEPKKKVEKKASKSSSKSESSTRGGTSAKSGSASKSGKQQVKS